MRSLSMLGFLCLFGCSQKKSGKIKSNVDMNQVMIMEPFSLTASFDSLNQELQGLKAKPQPQKATWNQEMSYISLRIGFLYGNESSRHLIDSRTYALNCLMTDPGFASLFRSNGSHLSFRVLRALDDSPQTVQCATLAVISWAKWIHNRNAGVSFVNHESLTSLAEWVWRRRQKVGDFWAGYALGLAYSFRTKWQGGNSKRAEIGFKASLRSNLKNPIWTLDYIEYSLFPAKKENEIKNHLKKLFASKAELSEASQNRLNRLIRRGTFSFDDE